MHHRVLLLVWVRTFGEVGTDEQDSLTWSTL